MSYYLNLSFYKGLIDESSIFNELMRVSNISKANSDRIIRDNIAYISNYEHLLIQNKSQTVFDIMTPENQLMLSGLFTTKFLYWKKFKLLAAVGPVYDAKYHTIEFFNSSDQDVQIATWNCLMIDDDCRKQINAIIQDTITEKNLADVLKEYEEFEDSDLGYKKRSYVYTKLEELLGIRSYLFDKSADIDVFEFGPSLTDREKTNIYITATKIINERIEQFNKGD